MPRGELVGEAFIRITGDTTAMRRAVKRAANEAGGDYTSEFGKQVEATADRNLAGARQRIADALAGGDFSRFEKQAGSVAGAVKNIQGALDQLRKQGDLNNKEWTVFSNTLKKWASEAVVEEQAKKDADALRALHTEAIQINKDFDAFSRDRNAAFAENARRASTEFERTHAIALRINREMDKANSESFRKMRAEAEQMNRVFDNFNRDRNNAFAENIRRTNAEFEKTHGIAIRLNREFDKGVIDDAMRDAALHAARFNDQLKRSGTIQFGKQFTEARVDIEKIRQGLRGADALIFKTAGSADGLAGGLRRSSREGSGLFSVFGGINKTLEGISHRGNPLVDLFVAPLRAGAAFGKFFENLFGKSFAKIAGGSRVLGLFGSLAGSIGAAAVAIGVMVKAASLLSSALSLVAGMATIAASAIGGALVGAIALAAGTVPALIGTLGGLILFFKDFEKQAPKATAAAKVMGEEFRNAFDQTAFRDMDDAITRTITALRPLTRLFAAGLGDAVNKGLGTFISLLNDPNMKAGLDSLLTIPGQVNRVLNIASEAAFGALGVFRALSPFITKFLDQVNLLAIRFNVWANSTKGQSSLTSFFKTVIDMAGQLLSVLGNVGRIIGSVFTAAAEGGTAGKFLDLLVRITDRFADFLGSTEGQNKLKDWFDDAYRAGQAVGDLIRGVAAIFGALDTSKSRDQITRLTSGIGDFLTRQAPNLEKFVGFIDKIGDSFGRINLGPFAELGGIIGDFIGDIAGALEGDALGAIDQKFEGFNDLADTLKNDLNPALKNFLDVIKPVVTWVGSTSFKNLASSFQGVAALIDGAATSLSGFLDVLTGLLTLDFDKIKAGIPKIFEGIGKAAFGAFEAAFAGSGVKGILDKALGIDSTGVNFDTLQTQVSGFFDGISKSTADFDNNAGPAMEGFFSDLGQNFEDARLKVGNWFSETFKLPDLDEAGAKIQEWFRTTFTLPDFSQAGQTIKTWFAETFKLPQFDFAAIGQWFTDLSTAVGQGIGQATAAVQGFFTNLPNNIAYWLGAAAGSIVNFFYTQATAIITQWQTTVIPFFQGLPALLGSYFSTAINFLGEWFSNMWNGVFAYFETVAIPWVVAIPGRIEAALDTATSAIANWFSNSWNSVFAYFETVAIPWIVAIPGRVEAALDTATDAIGAWFTGMWNSVYSYFETTAIPWVAAIPGRIEAFLDEKTAIIADWFSGMWNSVFAYFENTVIPWLRDLPNRVENFLDGRTDALVNWFSSMWRNVQEWWSRVAVPWLQSLPGMVARAFQSVTSFVGGAIANQMKGVVNGLITQINSFIAGFNDFSPLDLPYLRYLAKGGEVNGPTLAMLGEGGKRELVIPMERPLSQIDPSVRGLAAIAQGRGTASTGPLEGSKTVNIQPGAIVATIPYSDPELAASALLDQITVEAFI